MSTQTYACGNSSTRLFINGNQCLQRRQSIALKMRKDEKNIFSIYNVKIKMIRESELGDGLDTQGKAEET